MSLSRFLFMNLHTPAGSLHHDVIVLEKINVSHVFLVRLCGMLFLWPRTKSYFAARSACSF